MQTRSSSGTGGCKNRGKEINSEVFKKEEITVHVIKLDIKEKGIELSMTFIICNFSKSLNHFIDCWKAF